MPRPVQHPFTHTRLLGAAIAVSVILIFIPARWLGWLNGFSALATTIVEPVRRPVSVVSRWLVPAREPFSDNEDLARLQKEKAELELFLDREKQESARLRALVEQLQAAALYQEPGVRRVVRDVIGTSADGGAGLLEVRAGSHDGIARNTVATVGGLQLLGRVEQVSGRTCKVRLITRRESGSIGGLISTAPEGSTAAAPSLACPLTPVGDGTLRGPVAYKSDPAGAGAVRVEKGQVVRVDGADGAWPKAARSLIIGKVVDVKNDPSSPLRQIVTVLPTVEHIERVAEVQFLITEAPEADDKK